MITQKETEYIEKLEQAIRDVAFSVTNQYTAQRAAIDAYEVVSKEDCPTPSLEEIRSIDECNGTTLLARIVYRSLSNTLKVPRKDLEDWAFYKEEKRTLKELIGFSEK